MEIAAGPARNPGVAIVGCGLIGKKRAQSLGQARLVTCFDVDPVRSEVLARSVPSARIASSLAEAVTDPEVDIAIIATTNDALAPAAHAALEAGKHVLLEKPGARTPEELEGIRRTARRTGQLVRVGFNHRYHPALKRAKDLQGAGEVGELMFLRGRYGHGGRLGYEKEWRADRAVSGGGELIDQGVHLIDLSRWFLGNLKLAAGTVHTYFWDMPVDDNAFLVLESERRQTAFLHVTCTEWKNLFCLEVYGRTGKLQIDGLGGSYGVERLSFYRMLPAMGPPETTIWEFPRGDDSWSLEFSDFLEDIRLRREPDPGLGDALAALEIVDRVYSSNPVPGTGSGRLVP